MVAEVRANANALSDRPADREFRKLAEHIPALCWIADAEGYITWYNPKWYEYTGTTPSDMEGWGYQSVHDPRTLPDVLERWKADISAAKPFEMVFPIRGADGVLRPFLTRINPAFDDSGAVTNWYGVNTDISLQVEAEDAVLKTEARFRVLADSMPQLVWSATPDGARDYHNARWYEFTGAPIGACDGDAWADWVHPEDRARALAAWTRAREAGEGFQVEYRLRRGSGEHRWVLAGGQPERDAQGRVSRWYGACTDIDEIVQARLLMQRSHDELEALVARRTGERNLLATLVERTDVMVMALDRDYRILAINRANIDEFERVSGVRPQVGDNMLDLLAGQPEQQAAARAAWARALAGEEYTVIESYGDPSRARSDYEVSFRTLRDEAGELMGAFHFVADVTQRLKDQRALAQAQEALFQAKKLESMGELTGGVAHDFNNLLTPILGALDMLERHGVGGEREQRLIHGALESAERARTLIHRLLAFARRQPLQAAPVDVGELVRGMADLVASAAGPTVAVALEVADSMTMALADRHQLEMAILNLGVNARDAMEGTGRLTISVGAESVEAAHPAGLKPGAYVRICVSDTGKGMDEATRARAIEPFFSTKGPGQGTGLGLSMAHGLASQLGGALTIDSQPGQGSQIAIWLPQSVDPPLSNIAPQQKDLGDAHEGLVLLVDDEAHIRAIATEMLTELGFRVHEAVSPEAALAAVDAGLEPDIMITDHIMPGMTGVELAYAVKARRPKARTLIISGYAEVETLDPALPRLSKPFKQSDLAGALAALAPPPRPSRGKAAGGVRDLQAPLAAPLECSISEPLL
jgi:PAS domain S-box-containing protein